VWVALLWGPEWVLYLSLPRHGSAYGQQGRTLLVAELGSTSHLLAVKPREGCVMQSHPHSLPISL
jgi:hypothetical protein